jgi:hypothetical protein
MSQHFQEFTTTIAFMTGAERHSVFTRKSKHATSSHRREDTRLSMSSAVKQLKQVTKVVLTLSTPTTHYRPLPQRPRSQLQSHSWRRGQRDTAYSQERASTSNCTWRWVLFIVVVRLEQCAGDCLSVLGNRTWRWVLFLVMVRLECVMS